MTIIAENVADAVAQIRAKLGPSAVVTNVRKIPASGITKLWQKPKIEVIAIKQDQPTNSDSSQQSEIAILRQELDFLKQTISKNAILNVLQDQAKSNQPQQTFSKTQTQWKIPRILEDLGFMPGVIGLIMDRLETTYGKDPPKLLSEEILLLKQVLSKAWRTPEEFNTDSTQTHIFIGPMGSGKSVLLCKILARTVLCESRKTGVWLMDTNTVNLSEIVPLYCEILNVPFSRGKNESFLDEQTILLVDLPGVDWKDSNNIEFLNETLKTLQPTSVHLVLNASIETRILFAQLNAFSRLKIDDLNFTHIDEEPRWGKLWNFVLGTNFSIRWLSAGQNIPGQIFQASAESLINQLFPQ